MYSRVKNLSRSNIDDDGAVLLASLPNVLHLNLDSNNVRDKGAEALAKSDIRSLNLNNNWLGESGGKILLEHSQQTTLMISKDTAISEKLQKEIQVKIFKRDECASSVGIGLAKSR